MFYGTESGKVIGFQLNYSDDKEVFDILYFNFDPSFKIIFIDYKKNFLIVSSESSRMAVLHLKLNQIKK